MTKRISDSNLHSLGWELNATDGRWYWTGGDDGLSAKIASNTSRIAALEAGRLIKKYEAMQTASTQEISDE